MPDGTIQLAVDYGVVPMWKPPRKAIQVTLQEFALDAESYPMCCYDIPAGQRVIVMGTGIFDIKGRKLCTNTYTHEQLIKLFFPIINVAYNHNLVFDGVVRYNANYDTSELVLCDCFCGQDWNSDKIMMPINLRRQLMEDAIEKASMVFYKKMKHAPRSVCKNFRAVSDVWVFSIKDVIAEYTLLSYKEGATGLLLIDAKQTNPHDAYYENISGGASMPFRFDEQERCWKILVPKQPKESQHKLLAPVEPVKTTPSTKKPSTKNPKK